MIAAHADGDPAARASSSAKNGLPSAIATIRVRRSRSTGPTNAAISASPSGPSSIVVHRPARSSPATALASARGADSDR